MKINKTFGNGLFVLEPDIYKDNRGYFYESFNEKFFKENVADIDFVQDNQSKSGYGIARGLHFQKPPYAQSKLVRVIKGSVIDIAVDIRKNSPTYGEVFTVELTEKNHLQFFIPQGFAHGFISLDDDTIFQYKCDNFYNKESEGVINFNTTFKNNAKIFIPENKLIFSEKDINNSVNFDDFISPFEYNN